MERRAEIVEEVIISIKYATWKKEKTCGLSRNWVHTYTHETVLGSGCRLIDICLIQLAVIIMLSLPI